MIYQWSGTAGLVGKGVNSLDVQPIGERLEKLHAQHGGKFTASDVVADATSKKSPLHPCFEWDDSAAAVAHRLQQARMLIGAVTVIADVSSSDDKPVPVRVFVSTGSKSEKGYDTLAHVLSEPELRRQFLEKAARELDSFQIRYGVYEELAGVITAAERFKAELGKKPAAVPEPELAAV